MEIVSSVPQQAGRLGGLSSLSRSRHRAKLSVYDGTSCPALDFGKMSLDQFAQLGWDRVRVLQKFDEVLSHNGGKSSGDGTQLTGVEQNAELNAAVKRHLAVRNGSKNAFGGRVVKSPHFDQGQVVLDTTSKDILSHFIVRLAYCRTEDLRKWVLAQEVALFKWRFQNTLLSTEQAKFVRNCGELGKGECQAVTEEEYREMKDGLLTASHVSETAAPSAEFFYKIRFEYVVDLVRRRQVVVKGGWAFVHRSHIVGMLAGLFRARLSKALVQLARKWPSFARVERDRLLPIVAQLSVDRRQLANPVDDKAVLQTFTTYIQQLGHSAFKTKQLGRDKVGIGSWRRPNDADKCCPFARRVHKSNTVHYTIHLADKVMVQKCWDSDCRHGRRFFQIRGGKVVDLKFEAPNRQEMTDAEKKSLGPLHERPANNATPVKKEVD